MNPYNSLPEAAHPVKNASLKNLAYLPIFATINL